MVVWTPKKMVFIKNSQGYVIVGTVNKPHSSSCGVFFVVGCPKRYVARSLMRVMRGEDARPQNHQRFDTRQTLKLGCGRAVFGKSELLVHESKTTTTVSKKTPTKKKNEQTPFSLLDGNVGLAIHFFMQKNEIYRRRSTKTGLAFEFQAGRTSGHTRFFLKNQSPGDSSRALFTPDRWRSLNPLRGSLNHPKKVTNGITRLSNFEDDFVQKTPSRFEVSSRIARKTLCFNMLVI